MQAADSARVITNSQQHCLNTTPSSRGYCNMHAVTGCAGCVAPVQFLSQVLKLPSCLHTFPALQLVELQEDAWKLQMLVELQRMGQQLERLASQEDEATTGTKDPGSAEQTAQDTQAAAGPSTGA